MISGLSAWIDEWGTQIASTTTTIPNLFYGTNSTATTGTYAMQNYIRTWVEHDHQTRTAQFWAHSQQGIQTQIAQHQAQLVQMRVEWTAIYGQHLAETVERERARAALDRHALAHNRIVREQPEKRAEGLLLQHLSAEQRAEYERSKWFLVEGKSGRRYRVRSGRTANVDALKPDGSVEHRLCAVLHDVPLGDHLLAQKLHLELAEQDFLRVAIKHPANPNTGFAIAA